VRLSSADPLAPPLIDPGLLNSEFELFAIRSGVENAMKFVSAPVWNDYILEPAVGLENITTQDQLDSLIRSTTGSPCHLVGTAAMSAKDANFGVVDPDLRVKGVTGLRVIDASIFVSNFWDRYCKFNHLILAIHTQWTYSGAHVYHRRKRSRLDQSSMGTQIAVRCEKSINVFMVDGDYLLLQCEISTFPIL
jgi:hypothetical protein